MRRWPVIALVVVVGVGAGWWFGSPWWTLYRMKTAAEAHDRTALLKYVDAGAVRTDAAAQIRERIGSGDRITLKPGDLAMIGEMVMGARDGLPSPEELVKLLGLRAEDMTMHRDGLDQFRMVSTKGTELVFRRHGLGWKLAAVRV